MNIPITKPLLGLEEERAVSQVIQSGWLVQGPKVVEFERTVADYVGVQHAVAVSSCTTALHLALILCGIGLGDEVIVPSFTFIATANVVRHTGATPVFVDIDPCTYNLHPEGIEAAITPRTKAIMPVHQIGLAADIDRINVVARQHDLVVIEDAAPAIGAMYKGKRVGDLGNPTCFSFHPRKVITSGEGGMILTNDENLAERARLLRAHGMSLSDLARHQAKNVVIEEYHDIGYNYRMSDLHAAVGIEQMKKLNFILTRRKAIAEQYDAALSDYNEVLQRQPGNAPLFVERGQIFQQLGDSESAKSGGALGLPPPRSVSASRQFVSRTPKFSSIISERSQPGVIATAVPPWGPSSWPCENARRFTLCLTRS